MKRVAALLLTLLLLFPLSAALAQRANCPEGGFSVKLPDHFVEESFDHGSGNDLIFWWHGNKLTVQAYSYYQGEGVDISELFQVLDSSDEDYGLVSINGKKMYYSRSGGSEITVSYSWMNRGYNVTMYFTYSASESSVINTVNSIINSIRFD